MQNLRVPDMPSAAGLQVHSSSAPEYHQGLSDREEYLYLLDETSNDESEREGALLVDSILSNLGCDNDYSPRHAVIPEFALDSDFFDFLYTVYQAEEWADPELRADILDVVESYKLRREMLSTDSVVRTPQTSHSDVQGLLWRNREQRAKVVANRRRTFGSYTHLCRSIADASREVDDRLGPEGSSNLFAQGRFYTAPQLKLVHFQLRNLMAPFNSSKVYYASAKSDDAEETTALYTLDTDTGAATECNCGGHISPDFHISTLASSQNNYVVAGSFDGSLMALFPQRNDDVMCWQISQDPNRIINYVLVSQQPQCLNDLVVASNDTSVCVFDMVKGRKTNRMQFEDPINCIAENPNCANELLLVGDSTSSLIVDKRQSQAQPIHQFRDHHDYSFACGWHTDHLLATGNQDSTIRLYDDRYLEEPLTTIGGFYNGAVRNLAFGKHTLAFAESIDNVYLVDLRDPDRYQLVDFFGKVAGLGFSATVDGYGEQLSIGVSDASVGGILRYTTEEATHASFANGWI